MILPHAVACLHDLTLLCIVAGLFVVLGRLRWMAARRAAMVGGRVALVATGTLLALYPRMVQVFLAAPASFLEIDAATAGVFVRDYLGVHALWPAAVALAVGVAAPRATFLQVRRRWGIAAIPLVVLAVLEGVTASDFETGFIRRAGVERGAHQAVDRALREPKLDLRLGRPVAALGLAHRRRRLRALARGPHRRPRVLQGGALEHAPVSHDDLRALHSFRRARQLPESMTGRPSERVKGAWEDLFERGFARIRCPACAAEYLLAFMTEGRVIRRILAHPGASARRATQDRTPPLAAAPVPDSL